MDDDEIENVVGKDNYRLLSIQSNRPYIPEENFEAINKFKYAGEDRSYLYVYFFSPLADRFAMMLPYSMPPNVITLVGFLLNIVSHLLLVYYQGMTFEGELPTWVPVTVGINYFLYVFLDNTDGKQARRTKTSSVLGMLFDHGCDGYTSILISVNLAMIIQPGFSAYTVLPCFIATIPFYMATLESYFIGGVYLPEVNAVTDGCFAIMALCFYAAYCGSKYFMQIFIGDLRLSHCLAFFFVPLSVVITCQNIYCIFYKETRVRKANFRAVAKAVLYVLIVSLVIIYTSINAPGNILHRAPLLVSYLFGLLIQRPVNLMQLHLVTAQKLNLWRRGSIVTLLILLLVCVYGEDFGIGETGIVWVFTLLVLFNAGLCFHLFYFQCYELSQILDIDVFSIKRQIEKSKKEHKE